MFVWPFTTVLVIFSRIGRVLLIRTEIFIPMHTLSDRPVEVVFIQNIVWSYLLSQQDWGTDKLNRAQQTIIESPYDLEAWSLLIRESQIKWINDVRPLFEKLVTTFPSSGRYWKIYIEQEVSAILYCFFLFFHSFYVSFFFFSKIQSNHSNFVPVSIFSVFPSDESQEFWKSWKGMFSLDISLSGNMA